MSAAVQVREFALGDVAAAARFCEAARALDPDVEPFGQRLGTIAALGRAQLPLWRVACDATGAVQGIAFAALRESPEARAHDLYCAVHPALRRQGVGRALCQPALACEVRLRARVSEGARPGRAFLAALGFVQTSAQLSLRRAGGRLDTLLLPALQIRAARARDGKILRALVDEAWVGAPDAFLSRADDLAQVLSGPGRLTLLAEWERQPAGYLAAAQLGGALGIEELAVLPRFRRMGIGRALLGHALRDGGVALISVGEGNPEARALYASLGFETVARRLVLERGFGEHR
ncbi:MAG TPA: GNAT family N-acetyltransferase [Myxococcales bacterium]|nr:GNAT family N-acetyltransferase [Myxococcales bacterium]